MTGATDFLQLYKVTSELIQSPEDKEKIIESVFEILKSKDPDDFYDRYEALKRALENANKNMEDFKLTRLYNRLWHIFSFFLNSLYPGVFPIYFPDTRAVCDKHGIDGYGGIAHAFSDFKEKHKEIIEKYIKRLGIYDIESIEGAYLMKKDVLSKLFI